MNENDALIMEQMQKLPEALRMAINSVPWKSTTKKIALLNNLDPEQISTLERETMFIIFGFENPSDYIQNIVLEVEIDEVVATTIAEAVNEKILQAIERNAEEIEKETSVRPTGVKTSVPELAPDNLPMVEENEKVHDIPHVEPTVNLPDYRYTSGKDPYKEQI